MMDVEEEEEEEEDDTGINDLTATEGETGDDSREENGSLGDEDKENSSGRENSGMDLNWTVLFESQELYK